jgi:hypothetical protein
MQRKTLCGFELHMGRVMHSFRAGATEPPVLSLLTAMLLLVSTMIFFIHRVWYYVTYRLATFHKTLGRKDGSKGSWRVQSKRLRKTLHAPMEPGMGDTTLCIIYSQPSLLVDYTLSTYPRCPGRAMTLLGQWFHLKGRMLEGQIHNIHAIRFAVALGLHRLNSRIYHHYITVTHGKPVTGLERWRPRDPVELGEGINVWW